MVNKINKHNSKKEKRNSQEKRKSKSKLKSNSKSKLKSKKNIKYSKIYGGASFWPNASPEWKNYWGTNPDPKKIIGKGSFKTVLTNNEPGFVIVNSTNNQEPDKFKQIEEKKYTDQLDHIFPNTCAHVRDLPDKNAHKFKKYVYSKERLEQVQLNTYEDGKFYLDEADKILLQLSETRLLDETEVFMSCLDIKPGNFGVGYREGNKCLLMIDVDPMFNRWIPVKYKEYILAIERIILLGYFYQSSSRNRIDEEDIVRLCKEMSEKYDLTRSKFKNIHKDKLLDGTKFTSEHFEEMKTCHKECLVLMGLTHSSWMIDMKNADGYPEHFSKPAAILRHYLPMTNENGHNVWPITYLMLVNDS